MERHAHERVVCGNQELRRFLKLVQGLADGNCTAGEADLKAIGRRLSNSDYSIGEASRAETLDADLLNEIADYVENLQLLQIALEELGHRAPPGATPETTQLEMSTPVCDEQLEFVAVQRDPA